VRDQISHGTETLKRANTKKFHIAGLGINHLITCLEIAAIQNHVADRP